MPFSPWRSSIASQPVDLRQLSRTYLLNLPRCEHPQFRPIEHRLDPEILLQGIPLVVPQCLASVRYGMNRDDVGIERDDCFGRRENLWPDSSETVLEVRVRITDTLRAR
jgi:hypothetical protein